MLRLLSRLLSVGLILVACISVATGTASAHLPAWSPSSPPTEPSSPTTLPETTTTVALSEAISCVELTSDTIPDEQHVSVLCETQRQVTNMRHNVTLTGWFVVMLLAAYLTYSVLGR